MYLAPALNINIQNVEWYYGEFENFSLINLVAWLVSSTLMAHSIHPDLMLEFICELVSMNDLKFVEQKLAEAQGLHNQNMKGVLNKEGQLVDPALNFLGIFLICIK